MTLDPQSGDAKTFLAGALVNRFGLFTRSSADLARAEKLIDEALAAGTGIAWAHYEGTMLRAKGQWEDAISEFETARMLDRNMTGPLQGLGWCKLFTGSLDEVIPLAEEAIRLSPRDPAIGFRYLMVGFVDHFSCALRRRSSRSKRRGVLFPPHPSCGLISLPPTP